MKEKSMLKNEEGSILIVTVLILLLLTFLGFWSHNTTDTELQIAGSDKTIKTVFYAADAGIEVGRAALGDLKRANKGNWDNLLKGVALVDDRVFAVDYTGITTIDGLITTIDGLIEEAGDITRRDVGQARFTLAVRDNDDLDGDDTVDSDNTIILTSTARLGAAEAQVEAYLRFDEDEYRQEHYDASSTGVAE